jgi:diguanylate cyclase (GGDEF)-like protein
MNAPRTAEAGREPRTPVYEAYAQLTKMLLPSSGCVAIYDVEGDMAWCSDGFERPDFRELVEAFGERHLDIELNQGVVRETSAGGTALIAKLGNEDQRALGYALIELGQTHSSAARSMAASMTRPIFHCLASQLALEAPCETAGNAVSAEPRPETVVTAPAGERLEFLLGIGQIDLSAPHAIRSLLQRCVDHLDCLSAVFCIPDHDFTEITEQADADAGTRAQLDATRRHLLAWAQLNNRPMVVNRVDVAKAPYKILSCPVVDQAQKPKGLMALFRGPESANFELDDVRLMQFLARQGMALLTERQDSASGLMRRSAFERLLDERLAQSRPSGTLLYLDIDDLKTINESFGYSAGDEAIVRTARLIHRLLTPGEFACRLSADRFVAFLPERDADNAMSLGSELATAARSLNYGGADRSASLSLRFGVAAAPESVSESRHWIAEAELACQQARAARPVTTYNAVSSRADR